LSEIALPQRLTLLLDESSLNKIQRWLWVLSTGGTLLDGYVIFVLGVAMPIIIAEFHIQPDVVGLIGASLVFGAVIGAGVGGPMADHLGRKKLMLADMIIIGAGASVSALAEGPAMLFIGQLLVGMGVGIDFPVSSSYVSEILPKPSRARMMVATIACQSVGMLLAAAITLVLLRSGSAQPWRLFLATEGAVALLFFVLRLSAPESPHWLMSRGKFEEATQVFIRIIPEQRQLVLQLTGGNQETLAAPVPQVKRGVTILFSHPYWRRTALVTIPWFLMDIATYGVGLFTPAILGAIEISERTRGLAAHDFALAEGSALIDLFLLFGFLLGVWMVPRFGRLRMQAIGFAGMAAGMLLLAAVSLTNSSWHIPMVFVGFILFNLLMNAGPNSTTFTLAPILFPTQLRGTAAGFAAGVAKLGATVGVFLLPILKEKFGVPSVLGIVSAVSLLSLVVTLALRREDAHQPCLE